MLAGAFRHTVFMAKSTVFHHVWVEYALTMLHSAFRRSILSKRRHQHLLEPFALILARCLKLSKENKVTILSLRCLAELTNWTHLDSMASAVPTIVEQTFRVIRQDGSGSGGKEIQHVGFKVITQIMHTVKSEVYHFKDNQYRAMINLIRTNMEDVHSQNTSFALIKAMLARKVMVPEMYDLMSRCSRMMVTAHRTQVQKLCGQVFLRSLPFFN